MKILIAQGGGPTAVINQSLIGAVLSAQEAGLEIIGARHGIRGIVEETFVDFSSYSKETLLQVANTPSSALGSTRDKPDTEYCSRILEVIKKHNIKGLLYIGGNDSSETIKLVLEAAERAQYHCKGFHIPKTIDNDLMENDHTPGFPSAARYVAKAVMGLQEDNRSLPGVHLCIIMGRHAGFLTAAAALGGAHRVYVPEHAVSLDSMSKEIEKTFNTHGRAVIAISEGIQNENGEPLITQFVQNEHDAHGNVQLSGLPLGNVLADYIKANTSIKRVRQDTFGYPQRCYPDASSVDAQEAFEVGRKSIQYLQNNELQSGSIVIKRVNNSPYQSEINIVDLAEVANKTRHLPTEFYDLNTKNITPAGLEYLKPLVGELPQMAQL